MEDDRLALAFLAVCSRADFTPDDYLREWATRYRSLFTRQETGERSPGATLAISTLHSLRTLVQVGANVEGQFLLPAHPQATLDAIRDALRSVYDYYGPAATTNL